MWGGAGLYRDREHTELTMTEDQQLLYKIFTDAKRSKRLFEIYAELKISRWIWAGVAFVAGVGIGWAIR
jgi:hypothetical protein